MREPVKGETEGLSQKAKFRLKVLGWHYHKPALYSLSGLADASLACRHFGIHRPVFADGRYDTINGGFQRWKTGAAAPETCASPVARRNLPEKQGR
jgi:hypothetical protein